MDLVYRHYRVLEISQECKVKGSQCIAWVLLQSQEIDKKARWRSSSRH